MYYLVPAYRCVLWYKKFRIYHAITPIWMNRYGDFLPVIYRKKV